MSKQLIIPIKLDVAGFVARIEGFASQVEELILKAESLANDDYADRRFEGGPEEWRDHPRYLDLVNLIDAIRPVVEKVKEIGHV